MDSQHILYHVSSLPWRGETTITLLPGPQGAEGRGVYFSEGEPRLSAAEGARAGAGAIFLLTDPGPVKDWWRSKGGAFKRHARPRTWRTLGAPITLTGLHKAGEINGLPVVAGRKEKESDGQ